MTPSLNLFSENGEHAISEDTGAWSVVLIFYSSSVISESDVDNLLSSVDRLSALLEEQPAALSGAHSPPQTLDPQSSS